jgi:hypothetical protein
MSLQSRLRRVADVQGTVRSFDVATSSGDLLLDDGTAVDFDGAAFATSGLLRLRVGQRVRLRRDPEGRVVFLTLATFPDRQR